MDVQLIIPPAAGSREERLAQIEAKIKQSNGGRRSWRQWKQYEADEILALARKRRG